MSGGIDMYAEDGHKVLGVYAGLHNISYGVKHYDLVFTSIDGFTVERMLADKLLLQENVSDGRKIYMISMPLPIFLMWICRNFLNI